MTTISVYRRGALFAPLLLLLLIALPARGETIYQPPEQFVAEGFAGEPPTAKLLWLNGAVGDGYRAITGEAPRRLRLRYWSEGARDLWILEAIGKEQPITAGFIVEEGRIVSSKVLIFRESRGWEIHNPFFIRQFSGAQLDGQQMLDRPIDGISGATLSVRAMVQMSRLALYLSRVSREKTP